MNLHYTLPTLLALSIQASTHNTTYSPFPPSILASIQDYSSLPPLINASSATSSINPADLDTFLQNAINTKNSQPNPIASEFPNSVTGTINATYTVVPLDYTEARRIVPSKHGILEEAIKEALPGFEAGKYPLFVSTQIDHDVQSRGVRVPDFTLAQFRFPFIDLLGDGYSTFSYVPSILISANPIAIAGSALYGGETIPATFNPPKDPYEAIPGDKKGRVFFKASRIGGKLGVDLDAVFKPQPGKKGEVGEYPLSFYANVTNQPTFSDPKPPYPLTCDNQIRFFNTRITQGEFRPIGVTGKVSLATAAESGVSVFPKGLHVNEVRGARMDVAFIENNYLDCEDLKGYQYQGV